MQKNNIKLTAGLELLKNNIKSDVFVVGGYIRNSILNLGITDIDLTGPKQYCKLSLPLSFTITPVNKRLGTAQIKTPNGEIFEYTPFRTESYQSGGHHSPNKVQFTNSLEEDSLRRDFTSGSIYYKLKTKQLIDPLGGIADTKNRILRAHDPERIFADDGLRLIRLCRIASETGFSIEEKTSEAAKNNAHLLNDITKERIKDELNKIIIADKKYKIADAHFRGLKLLLQHNLIEYIIPELLLGKGIEQNKKYHAFDVLEHSLQAFRAADPSVRLAALLHDIGKPFVFSKTGKMTGHEKASAELCEKILGKDGLKFSNAVIEETTQLCRHHMVDIDSNTKETKLRLFIAKNLSILDKLFLLMEADEKGSGVEKSGRGDRIKSVKNKMEKENAPYSLKELQIKGSDLLELNIKGQAVGRLLNYLLEKAIINPEINNKKDLLNIAKKYIIS